MEQNPNPQYLLLATNTNHLSVSKELVIEMWQHLIILQVSTGQNVLLMTGNISTVIFQVYLVILCSLTLFLGVF